MLGTERVRTHGSVKPTTANYWNPLGLSVSYKNRFYLATGILEKKILGNANQTGPGGQVAQSEV